MADPTPPPFDVFISYSHQDHNWVWDHLLPHLEDAGLRVCIDKRDFEIGVPTLINIERAIDQSRHTLLVLTPAWLASAWAQFESLLVGSADPAARQRKLIPLMLVECELPRRIGMLTWADFCDPQKHESQFKRLIGQLQAIGSTSESSAKDRMALSNKQELPLPPKMLASPESVQINGDAACDPHQLTNVKQSSIATAEKMSHLSKYNITAILAWFTEHIKWTFSGVGVAVLFTLILPQFCSNNSNFSLTFKVIDLEQENEAVSNAIIRIETGGEIKIPVHRTDSDGSTTLQIPGIYTGKLVTLEVNANGYKKYRDDDFYLQETDRPIQIILTPVPTETPPGTQSLDFSYQCPDHGDFPKVECEALVALYKTTGGNLTWYTKTHWLEPGSSPCQWYGVGCENGHVSRLILNENQLAGPIPAELSALSALQALQLHHNQLTGPIPSELGRLPHLSNLMLQNNQLSGAIPVTFGQLINLQVLGLHQNSLSGSIPPELGELTQLAELQLSNNQFSGAIPPELGNLSNLKRLGIAGTNIAGAIPRELGNLSNLETLALHNNQLSGTIPPELGKLINLVALTLSENQLTGTIPSEIGSLTNLTLLWLFNNQLSGSIPMALGSLINLKCLSLDHNQLSGEVPFSFLSLHQLKGKGECDQGRDGLDLGNNHLVVTDPDVRNFLNANAPGWLDSQTQLPTIDLLVADFNSCAPPNNLGGAMDPAYNPPDQMQESYLPEAGRGCVAKLEYMGKEWGGFWMKLQDADLSQFSWLKFDIKADLQLWIPDHVKIELKRNSNKEMLIKYVEGITDDWQTIVVALADFGPTGTSEPLSTMTAVEELSFVIEPNGSDITSVIYIDNIAFIAEDGR